MWKAWGVAVLSALLSLYAAGLIYEGFAADRYIDVFTYPFIDKLAAQRSYDRLSSHAPAALRTTTAQRLIEADPANPEGWTAVAYADFVSHGHLSPQGVLALDHSYTVSFFDRPGAIWRVSFALENWGALTPQLRDDVLTEAQTALDDPLLAPILMKRLARVNNPQGRAAAIILLATS